MGLSMKLRWLHLVVLMAVLSATNSRQNVPRNKRQGEDWWRNYQSMLGTAQGSSSWHPEVSGQSRRHPEVSGQSRRHPEVSGQSRRHPEVSGQSRRHPEVSGQSRRHPEVSGQSRRHPEVSGQSRRHPEVSGQSRQLSSQNPISVQCEANTMVVSVQRDLYGTGVLVKPSDLTLGPQRCTPSSQSTDTNVIFQNGLQDCGNRLQMTPDWLIYSTNLSYNPTPDLNSPIIRSNSAVVSIQCYYPRHGNVSSNAIQQTWIPFSSTVSAEERLSFSLHLMNDDWSAPRTSTVFHLGDIFNIEASIDSGNHAPMTIFVDSCVATASPDVNSSPHYEIISLNGCLMDGKQEDATSAFRNPRPQPDKIQFTVDAFRFTGIDSSTIYITCNLKAAAGTQAPDIMDKACTFNKATSTWSALEGPSNLCSCCDTGSCIVSAGQGGRWIPYYTGSRRHWKRGEMSGPNTEQEEAVATLGPILVVGSDNRKAFLSVADTEQMVELWILVGAGVLCVIVVVFACFAMNWRNFYNRTFKPE